MMENIFEIKDKTRRKIRLTKKQWKHITTKHPDMSSKERKIIEALEKPGIILPHKYDIMSKRYYRYDKNERAYLLVSVKYLNGKGFVITSFYTRHIKK